MIDRPAKIIEGILRHRTAMKRSTFSRPIQIALSDGLLTPGVKLFDYGCGLGDDIELLEGMGVNGIGWDPVHRPSTTLTEAPVVNLGYVVNVIEDVAERAAAVLQAWALAERLLIVSGRLSSELKSNMVEPFNDGFLTKANTFQKYFEQNELREWIDNVLGVSSVAAAPGIFYVFRDASWKEHFLASKIRRKPASEKISSTMARFTASQDLLKPLIVFLSQRGRLPDIHEQRDFEQITREFGSLRKAFRLIVTVTGDAQWEQAKKERTQDLLVYLALGRFGGRPRRQQLPTDLLSDIRAFFGTYHNACESSDRLLFEAGNRVAIDEAIKNSPVGKRTPSALYVHRKALPSVPPVLRVLEGCARRLVGEVEGANIIKIHRELAQVSYLGYPDFDVDPHPALAGSLLVHLQSFKISYRDYTMSSNPPILHRKEEFVMSDDPDCAKFRSITTQEEQLGLYDDPQSIGTTQGWRNALDRQGLTFVDGVLLRKKDLPHNVT